MHTSPWAPARSARNFFAAFLVALFAVGMSAAGASAAPATLTKVFGGPLANGTTCGPNATANNTAAAGRSDFCVAFSVDNPDGPNGVDLKSQVIDTPRGFAGEVDTYPQCDDDDFGVSTTAAAACPGAQMGSVAADIVVGDVFGQNVGLSPTGSVYNLKHSGNEVARLGIDLAPSLLGIPQPHVKIVVRVTLRPSPDVGLRSFIDNMPTDAATTPNIGRKKISIDEFALTFFGAASNHPAEMGGKNFGFLGSDCTNDQATSIRAGAYDGSSTSGASKTYRLTGCDTNNPQFKPSAEYSTSENRPDVTTETSVKVRFGASTSAAYQASAVKKTVVTLPEGLSFSGQIASGANGLPLCTAAQFAQTSALTNTCPAATQVGTVSFKSPLLANRLTGAAYLGPQPAAGELPDLFIQAELGTAADAPRVKLVGKLTIDDRNRIVTTLDDLPEVLVEEFALTFRGGDQAAVVTPPTCGTFKGALNAFSYAKPNAGVGSEQNYTVGADCDAVKTFAPTVGFALDNAAAGKSSPFTATIARADRSPRITKTQIDLPAGVLATLKGVPECAIADAEAGNCAAATKVGSLSSLAGVGPAPYSAPGEVFLTARQEGAVAGLSLRVPIVFGEVNLGVLNVPARIEIRADDLGLRFIADVPERFKGIPLNIRNITVKLDRQGFPLSPTNCGPLTTTSKLTGNDGTVADAAAGLQVNACDQLKFTPEIDAAVNGQTGQAGRPTVQVRVQNPAGNSALRQAFVTLPNGLGFDLKQTARSCTVATFKASGCPDVAKIGKVSGSLSITEEPLAGDLYLLKQEPGQTLPGLGLAFRGRFSGNVAGTNAVAKTGQLVTQFESLPDLPLTSFQIDVTGGNGGVLVASSKLCGSPTVDIAAKFVAHSGPTVEKKSTTFCGSKLGALTPRITAKLGGVRKGKPTLVFGVTAPLATTTVAAMKIKQIDVELPKGYSISTSRAKSSKGLAVKNLSLKGKSTSKRISARKLRVKLPAAGTTKAKILSRTGTISIASSKTRKSKAKVAITLTFTYTDGQKTSVPVRLTPR